MELLTADDYVLARWLFERSLAAIYMIAFANALNQFPALLGENGLAPVRASRFWSAPSLFYWHYSDGFLRVVAWTGTVLSGGAVLGIAAAGPIWLHMLWWMVMWLLYLSIVNIGGRFYGFGWESITLEAGFLAAFLGPSAYAPSIIPILLIRWLLFRVEFGAGLIKLRHDRCWRELTCLYYHYETQPLPNPLSRFFHRLPKLFHRMSVLFSHVVQVVVPFGLFAPQPVAGVAAGLIIFHQLMLIVSGNYAWLNWITVVLAFAAVPGTIGATALVARPLWFDLLLIALAVLTIVLSIQPTLNFFSRRQRMNFSYNPFHLVSAYGAFGSVTRKRYEVVVEGSSSEDPSDDSGWREYDFKAKPGDPARRPAQVAPYHYRLDWLMWFLPLSVRVGREGLRFAGYEGWFRRFVEKLLEGDQATLKLLQGNPFPVRPPRWIRARFYRYAFTTSEEHRQTGHTWKRKLVGEYLPPVSRGEM